eukprot:scaffold31295_cov27-Prasinocladus_malaysianus.AAC.1
MPKLKLHPYMKGTYKSIGPPGWLAGLCQAPGGMQRHVCSKIYLKQENEAACARAIADKAATGIVPEDHATNGCNICSLLCSWQGYKQEHSIETAQAHAFVYLLPRTHSSHF